MGVDSSPTTTAAPSGAPADASLVIREEVVRQILTAYPDALRAVVLTGSLARGEGTVAIEDGRARVLGDAEFLVIFSDRARLPAAPGRQAVTSAIETRLRERGVDCSITLSPVHSVYLRTLPPAIFTYELRACGQVVWGDPAVLALIPEFAPADIPEEDAWRLLCNRLVEQLDVAPAPGGSEMSPATRDLYRSVKLYLDMGTSLLVFLREYEPTYRGRSDRLTKLARQSGRSQDYPFLLEPFARVVDLCTRWKLDGHASRPEGVSWQAAIDRARRLWHWELERLAGHPGDVSDQALFEALVQNQSTAQRIRGWLHVLRKCGWYRSWRLWPRWARLARRASPRYLVYSAACELLFDHLSEDSSSPRPAADAAARRAIESRLPVIRRASGRAGARPWPDIVADVSWNYREFLVDTRA